MIKIPYCHYPKAADYVQGLQPLPDILPVMNAEDARQYRSLAYKAVGIEGFSQQEVLQMARMIASSFAINGPMARHIEPPKDVPAGILGIKHRDPFGEDYFGAWTKDNILYWIIRLFILTDPSSPLENISINESLLKHSLAIQDHSGKIIGGAFNLPVSTEVMERPIRENDPFIDAVYTWFKPIHQFLLSQDELSLRYLDGHYTGFTIALNEGRVGFFNMIARSDFLPSEDSFELVAASMERFRALGYEYVVTAAAHQWTGSAFEVLGAVRVHYAPYRSEKKLKESAEGLQEEVWSRDGYLSDKDSGCMFYVLRLI